MRRGEAATARTMAAGPLLDRIDCWIFDLDNTLYSPKADLFGQIDVKMGQFIERLLGCDAVEARRVQKGFFHDHGTTLAGLMMRHDVEPGSFLDFVHDIDLSVLDPQPDLADALARLPGRKLVFTNGDEPYARRVLDRLGVTQQFAAVHDIIACDYVPKPQPDAYARLIAAHDIVPEQSLFVEDMARNLEPAKALGLTTIWVNNGSERGSHGADPAFIDHEINDVGDWLTEILGVNAA